MWGHEGELLGVFRDFHHASLHREILPHIINTHPGNYRHLRYIFIRMAPGDQEEILAFIRKTFREFAGEYPFDYTYLSDEIAGLYDRDRRVAGILAFFTFLALMISCMGIYGMARYAAEKRTRDLAIRRVFGAPYAALIRLSNTEMLQRTGVSLLLAVPLAYLVLEHWLRSFAFRTDLNWWIFLLGAAIGTGISVLATMGGIWKSMKQDPTFILKQI
jgi:putative ABC transport system permease protein